MSHDFSGLSKEEQLRAENDFLKMKLMLQHGAQLSDEKNDDLPPEIENLFLNNVLEFEKQFNERKMVSVFEKIGKPTHFKPVAELIDATIDECWRTLLEYMNEKGVDLHVCNPDISNRELYRFTIEELFEQETDNISIDGMTTVFVYDEFHCDPIYESKNAVERLFRGIFNPKILNEYFFGLHHAGIKLNDQFYENPDALKTVLNRFKSCFPSIELKYCKIKTTQSLPHSFVRVCGSYCAQGLTEQNTKMIFEGDFCMISAPDYASCWNVKEIEIYGVDFSK